MAEMEVGSWYKFPRYSVHGSAVKFYVYIRKSKESFCFYAEEQGSCQWVTGHEAFTLWNKLRMLHEKGNKEEFIELIKQIHKDNPKEY
jgi:hypothetical protein